MATIREQVVLQGAPDVTDHDRVRTLAEQALLSDQVRTNGTDVIASPYTQVVTDVVIRVDDDTVGGAVTVNLLPSANVDGYHLWIKKLGSTGTVTIDADGSETIDGVTTKAITTQFNTLHLYAIDGNWDIL